jgi:membrane protein DedA with SNARE-associated domain
MNYLGIEQAILFVEHYGYALLFLWVFAEQGALPVPSAPLLVAVGTLVRIGHLHLAPAIACSLAGALLADSVWFHFGRRRGKRVLRFLCRISLEPDSCVRRTENAFRKYGVNTLLVSKFIPGLNAVAAPLAGDSGISVVHFLAIDALGVVIWSGAYMGVGYLFTGQLERALGYVGRMGSGFGILVLGLFAAWILWKFCERRRILKQLDVARIAPEELRDRIAAGEDLYVVDLRSGPKDDSISIPGLIHLSTEDLILEAKRIPHDQEIILVCS